jgi:hypothetical protein
MSDRGFRYAVLPYDGGAAVDSSENADVAISLAASKYKTTGWHYRVYDRSISRTIWRTHDFREVSK